MTGWTSSSFTAFPIGRSLASAEIRAPVLAQVPCVTFQRHALGTHPGLDPGPNPGRLAPVQRRCEGIFLLANLGEVHLGGIEDGRLAHLFEVAFLGQFLELDGRDVVMARGIPVCELGDVRFSGRIPANEALQRIAQQWRRLEELDRDTDCSLRARLLRPDGVNDLRLQNDRVAAEAELELDLGQLTHLELLGRADEGTPIDDVPLVFLSEFGGVCERKA